ncbi:MAG TPA: hypothetical protein V6D34_09995 [Candidatus Sericytochromatia bacterium]
MAHLMHVLSETFAKENYQDEGSNHADRSGQTHRSQGHLRQRQQPTKQWHRDQTSKQRPTSFHTPKRLMATR